MPGNIHDPQHWLNRAEEIRTAAAGIKGPGTKALMLLIAQDYDKLAKRAAERASATTPRVLTSEKLRSPLRPHCHRPAAQEDTEPFRRNRTRSSRRVSA